MKNSNHSDAGMDILAPKSAETPSQLIRKSIAKHWENEPIDHHTVLHEIINSIEPINFWEIVGGAEDDSISIWQKKVVIIKNVLSIARSKQYGLCQSNGYTYTYNGQYWQKINDNQLSEFLGRVAERSGLDTCPRRMHLHMQIEIIHLDSCCISVIT